MGSAVVSYVVRMIKSEPVQAQAVVQTAFGVAMSFSVVTNGEAGALISLSAAVLAFVTRQAVTPLAAPRNSAGEALTPDAAPVPTRLRSVNS